MEPTIATSTDDTVVVPPVVLLPGHDRSLGPLIPDPIDDDAVIAERLQGVLQLKDIISGQGLAPGSGQSVEDTKPLLSTTKSPSPVPAYTRGAAPAGAWTRGADDMMLPAR